MKELINSITFSPMHGLFSLLVIAISVGLLATPYYHFAVLPGLIILILLLLGHFPRIGYYVIVFLIPFGAYRGLSETYQFLKLHWLIALWLILLISLQFLVQKKTSISLRSNLWPWFLIFFVISLVSALMSIYPLTSVNNLMLLLVAYLFIALNLVFISYKDFFKTLPIVLILSVSISSFLGIIGYIFNIPLFAIGTGSFTRGIGGSIDPNNLSLMIIFTLPLLAHWFFSSRRPLEKSLAIAVLIINLITIILTFSRGGAIVLTIVLSLLFIKHMHKFRPKYLGFITSMVAIAIVMIVIFVPDSYWERHKRITDTATDRSIGRRVSYLYVGWEAFKDRPIIGSGPGTFRDIYADTSYARKYEKKEQTKRRYAHNTYLEVLTGTGVLGFIIFLMILWRTMRNFHLAKKRFQLYGRKEIASMVGSYYLSFISVAIYLSLISTVYHKYLLLSFALSQVSLRLSEEMSEGEHNDPADPGE